MSQANTDIEIRLQVIACGVSNGRVPAEKVGQRDAIARRDELACVGSNLDLV
jgi:hypothetical protein